MATNKFDQLVEDLDTGKLTPNMLQMAYRAHIRNSKHLPEGIKDILCGSGDSNGGLILRQFLCIREVIGSMDLAYRRGYDGVMEIGLDEG